jgi:hypothetical protein
MRDLKDAGGQRHAQFQALLKSFGKSLSVTDFFDLQRRLFEFRRRFRQFATDYDLLICP